MPRKKREIRAEYRRLGFVEVKGGGKGSHTKYKHPKLPGAVTIAGADGDDAKPYDEQRLAQAKHDLGV